MQYVKANPLRDPGVFCGHPPCPLCYDPADEDKVKDGFEDFWLTMLGEAMEVMRARMVPTVFAQVEKVVREAAMRVHQYNLNRVETDVFKEKMDAQQLQMQLDARVKQAAKDKLVAARPVTVLLDNIDLEKKEVAKSVNPVPAKVSTNFSAQEALAEEMLEKMVRDAKVSSALVRGGMGLPSSEAKLEPMPPIYDEMLKAAKEQTEREWRAIDIQRKERLMAQLNPNYRYRK